MIRAIVFPLSALSLAAAPIASQARDAAPMQHSEAIAGKAWVPWVIAAVVIAAVALLVAHDNKPSSP